MSDVRVRWDRRTVLNFRMLDFTAHIGCPGHQTEGDNREDQHNGQIPIRDPGQPPHHP